MKFISGKFLENEEVTVEINGKIITRKVRYNRADGLYIMYKNQRTKLENGTKYEIF